MLVRLWFVYGLLTDYSIVLLCSVAVGVPCLCVVFGEGFGISVESGWYEW